METADYATGYSGPPTTRVAMFRKRLQMLRLERTSWMGHWRELSDFMSPRRARLLYNSISGVNKGWKKNYNIINGKATWAARVQSAGMMAGITSPARPWFKLQVDDPDLNDYRPVRMYLDQVADRVRRAMLRCNFYKALPLSYWDLGVYGTSCFMLEEDLKTKLRAYSHPIGQYYLANSDRDDVDTLYREMKMTVAQVVKKFTPKGVDPTTYEKFSPFIRDEYKRGHIDLWADIVQVVEPNTEVDFDFADARGMRYRSCWFDNSSTGSSGPTQDSFLWEGGFEEQPFIATRWTKTAEDVYGSSPGMDVLGDTRALQLLEKRKSQLVDKITTPPMKGPASLQNQRVSLLPGDMTYVDSNSPHNSFEPAIVVMPQAVAVVTEAIKEHEQRIAEGYYADLWLMLAQNEMTMTATEVAERHEEKMLQLGPVLENVSDELLDPAVERFIAVLNRAGDLPPPPPELEDQDVNIEYTSVMAQAQKLVATTGYTKLAAFVVNLGQVQPNAIDKVNTDMMIEKMADALGVEPEMVRTEAEVKKIRDQRAAAQAQAQQHQMQMDQAKAAQQLGSTDMSSNNALKQLLPGAVATQGTAPGVLQ